MDEFNQLLAKYDQIDLVKIIAALQLIPLNHGKNVRLEILAKEILSRAKNSTTQIDYTSLQKFVQNNFKRHHLEDPVSSFFTENVIFFGGNFTVFPGLTHNGSRILNLYLESIFTRENALREEFKQRIHDGVTLILTLGDSICHEAGLKRYTYQQDSDSAIKLPPEHVLIQLKDAVTFSKDFIQSLAKDFSFDFGIIQEFVVDKNDKALSHSDPDKSPLLKFPLVQDENEFVFALPTAQVNCLIEFITREAQKHNCTAELLNCYYAQQWFRVRELCYDTGWLETDIQLPPKSEELNITESVFQFDHDKLAYVCLIRNEKSEQPVGDYESMKLSMEMIQKKNLLIEKRSAEVLAHLKVINGETEYKYFTLYVAGEMGGNYAFTYGKPTGENQTLALSFGDFEKLFLADDVDALSLWKFSKTYREASEDVGMIPFNGILDMYEIYRQNQESLLPSDDAPPTHLHFALGSSADFERKIVEDRDEHGALQYTEYGLLPVPVKRLRNFAPIYAEREKSKTHNLLLEAFTCPVWVKCNQAKSESQKEMINHFSEAIIFWLNKMKPALENYINQFGGEPVEIILKLDELLFETDVSKRVPTNQSNVAIGFSTDEKSISIQIPYEISQLLFLPDNSGEKEIMKVVLRALSALIAKKNFSLNFNEEWLNETVNSFLQPAAAKMILYVDSSPDMRLDTRWLLPYREIQDNDVSRILENLVSYLNLPSPIPEKIEPKQEKTKLCNEIVTVLVNRLVVKLSEFDSEELLRFLMKLYEKCIQKREFREIHIPAKIACFSDYPTEVEKFVEDEHKLVSSSIALRTLIEFITARPQYGKRNVNRDDVDELMALADQIISWGMLSDTIMFDMDDVEMGLLPSGRIGTGKNFFNESLKPFSQAKIEGEVFDLQAGFEKKLIQSVPQSNAEPNTESQEIDAAFESEFGISFTDISLVTGALIQSCVEQNDSVAIIEKGEAKNLLQKMLSKMSPDKLDAVLDFMTLKKRASISKAPKGFNQDDIYPWKYNRALSYLRKPVLEIQHPDGTVHYYWGFRHVYSAWKHLEYLLFTGKLKAREGGLLASYLSKINAEKGKAFRNQMATWLTENSSLKIIPYEVKINPTGHLIADKDLGDIDILAIDEEQKIIYSIECKNTVGARVIHEMKTELENYFGRDGKPGKIQKHVERDKWLRNNTQSLAQYVLNPENYQVKSIVLTSNELPVAYLTKHKSPLPIVSFQKLNREGVSLLKGL